MNRLSTILITAVAVFGICESSSAQVQLEIPAGGGLRVSFPCPPSSRHSRHYGPVEWEN